MNPVLLSFQSIAEIMDGSGTTLVTLVDSDEKFAINAICDSATRYQVALRGNAPKDRAMLLPEVLCDIFKDELNANRFCIIVRGLENGEYVTVLYDMVGMRDYPIKFVEAVILSRIVELPIYMHPQLFARQRVPYEANSSKTCLPINIISTDKVKVELEKAIIAENYRLASVLRDELRRRDGKGCSQTEKEE